MMLALRCTAKLLFKLGIERHPPDPGESTTALGDWYATILFPRGGHYLVLASERSMLTIVLEARRLFEFERRFLKVLEEELQRIRIPQEAIDREVDESLRMEFAPATNPTTIAYLNWIVREFKSELPRHPDFTIHDWAQFLDERPYGPNGLLPESETRRLLDPRSRFSIVPGGIA